MFDTLWESLKSVLALFVLGVGMVLVGALAVVVVAGPPLGITWLVLVGFGEVASPIWGPVVVVPAAILWLSILFWLLPL